MGPEDKLLHSLAKRKHPDFRFIDDADWYVENCDDYGNVFYICLICELKVSLYQYNQDEYSALVELFDHGFEHLKDSNLLVFL